MIELIHTLEKLRRDKAAICDLEDRLASPLLTDLNKMDEVYSTYREVGTARNTFILISVRLFSPRSLAGSILGAGVRNKMAAVLGCEPTVVSHAFKNLVFHYKKYKTFRREVDQAYGYVCEKMNIS